MTGEIEPIPPEEAAAILDAAIRKRLGDDWEHNGSGWMVVSRHAYMARITRDNINVDFYVDLLGEVRVEAKRVNPGQDVGRGLAWMLFVLALAIVFLLVRFSGLL